MRVTRVPLPGSATIAAVPGVLILLDSSLSRQEAALAVTGIMPDAHPDLVDHWLDQVFERPRFLYAKTMRALTAGLMLAACGTGGGHHHHGLGHTPPTQVRRSAMAVARS